MRNFPEASSAIINRFYVDDLLTGADSIESAQHLKEQLTSLLQLAGFRLTKWQSNRVELLQDSKEIAENHSTLKIDDNSGVTKVLGIRWNPNMDSFTFKLSPFSTGPPSKRKILSDVSKIFDPFGWLSPIIITLKILFQELWLMKLGWDEQLPHEVSQKWQIFVDEIPAVENISIQRRIIANNQNMQLHGFSDASEKAYGAVLYSRSIDAEGTVIVRIVAAKSRVAPLKQVSLPRLELCGALLLAKLIDKVVKALSVTASEIYTWTDSSIVLCWLSDVPRRWKNFVANRTTEIFDTIPSAKWRHVHSKDNPADLASRGVPPHQLKDLEIWWQGPKWLSNEESKWPPNIVQQVTSKVKLEERKQFALACVQQSAVDPFADMASRISSLSMFIRVLAYCYRFCSNCKSSTDNRYQGHLSASEIKDANIKCLKCVQGAVFQEELQDLTSKGVVKLKSKISSLTPFLDNKGLNRVGGRIQNADVSFNTRHPIVLPKHHPVVTMLVQELHRIYLHPGATLLSGLLRQRYWILGMRSIVSKVTHKCITCLRHRAPKAPQLMGNLPAPRVKMARPFSKVGVDYAGPINLTHRTGRGVRPLKGYIALFICMAVKAIHIELVTSLSTEAFIAALRRFISRRGIPSHIFSDNGTNFVGAKKYLRELHDHISICATNPLTLYFLSQNQITWQFTPPAAPHFGGLWEAGVKAVKWHLRRVLGETNLSFEEMNTLLCQVEAIINSRPYSALSSDPNDLDALTPGHFLIGAPPTTLPDVDVPDVEVPETKLSRLGRWRYTQSILQSFWRRWKSEYLTSLQQRAKWRTPEENYAEGDLVIIRDDNLPPSKWSLGRILSCHPGSDGLVRVATVKTHRGTLDRSIMKLVKLPIC